MVRFVNNVKTMFLLAGMMALFMSVGSMYGRNGLVLGLAFGGLVNVIAWFFSDKIALASMQGHEIDGSEGPETRRLYDLVDELRQKAGLPMPRVYICPHEAPNAFATGRSPSKAAVAVTAGTMRLLNENELRGVLGHELSHVKNRDTLTSCIAATIAGTLGYLARWGFMFGGMRSDNDRGGGNGLMALFGILVAVLGAALIKAMISRSREYVADADGARLAGSPNGLISALQKLEMYSKQIPLVSPNPAQNNLFIIEPFGGAATLMNLFASHPPTEDRIAALRSQA